MLPRRLSYALILLLGLALLVNSHATAAGPHVDVAHMDGAINPVMANYVDRAIRQAEMDGASALIIQTDTPGGLDSSMRDIIQRILAAQVPVVVYVAPPGSRDASAGVYITYAANVAAMAPNTNIGAAHPVVVGQGGQEVQPSDTEMTKITNDAVAYIRSLAVQRGRNADWAEQAVRQSVSISAQDALKLGVIDLIADDMPSLLSQLDGREVTLAGGTKVTLDTRDAAVQSLEMSWVENFLMVISDPTIAYILLSLGMMAIFFELSSPGAILPGVIGGLFLLLAFYALGNLPVNFAGLLLIGFAFVLFIADVFAVSHGVLTIGAVIALILGSLLLFPSSAGSFYQISLPVMIAMILCIVAFFVFVVGAVVKARRRRVVTGREGMLGQIGEARSDLHPKGSVFVQGTLWNAISENGAIRKGEKVEVIGVDGLTLKVMKAPDIANIVGL